MTPNSILVKIKQYLRVETGREWKCTAVVAIDEEGSDGLRDREDRRDVADEEVASQPRPIAYFWNHLLFKR